MANQTPIAVAAKVAAKEDARPTGNSEVAPAGPGRQRLDPAARAKKDAARLEARISGIEYRTTLVCRQLADMGVSSLAGQVQRYTDVPFSVRADAIAAVKERVLRAEAALEASKASKATSVSATVNLRASLGRAQ